jgi:hypothetical protein
MALWNRHRHTDEEGHRIDAWSSTISVRLAAAADLAALERLAGLDSRPLPPGPHLVAERDGSIEAALSLCTHELVANPFRRTAELCELLSCHAGGVRITAEHRRTARLEPRPQLVPA